MPNVDSIVDTIIFYRWIIAIPIQAMYVNMFT